jgi:signal transduction histidine kinase
MWILLTLFRRILGRLLRRLGWGALLVPVTAMGVALFGVHLWTVAAVAVALLIVILWPALAAGLLPATMAGMGTAGLVVAATSPGRTANWVVNITVHRPRPLNKLGTAVTALGQRLHSAGPPPVHSAGPPPFLSWVIAGRAWKVTPGQHVVAEYVLLPARTVYFYVSRPGQLWFPAAGEAAKPPPHAASWFAVQGLPPAPGLWQGKLLVPVALLLLTVGLWLIPRRLEGVGAWAAELAPDARRWLREHRWSLLLVPTTLLLLPAFGLRLWTVSAVCIAVLLTVMRPALAADLVPVVLAGFAAYGFVIAARGQALAPGAEQQARFYGAILVRGRESSMLAGAQASAFLAFGAWLVPRTIGAHVRTLLNRGPDIDLAGRVKRLTETRGHAIDTAAAELRRIERDLHDGAQARLVALGMNLRAAERVLPGSPQAALALVAEARETSVRALTELRDLIRGICPPVLADRGLCHAVRALVLDTPLPTTLDIDMPGRLTAPVESACYFAIAEALANAVKHSGARSAQIRIQHSGGLLRIQVADDGTGGADPAQGTGLAGVERRLGTFDGILAVNSPPGGPTMIAMEVPCALLSPKTCSC